VLLEERCICSTNHFEHGRLVSIILLCGLAGLLLLAFRPFGFRTFLHELENNNILALLLVVSVVGICMVLLQRVGIIFSSYSSSSENYP
jgi:glucan phosphoethanolaminetransferase (alkaline phosphatase superfamily)